MRLWIKGKIEQPKEKVEKDVEVSLRGSCADGITVCVNEVGYDNVTPLLDIDNGIIYLRCCQVKELQRLGFRTKDNGEVEQR